MNLDLIKLMEDDQTLSLIGICKNAGKTTVLNSTIKAMNDKKIVMGITSIGRDGEEVDTVTHTKKPHVHVQSGTVLATATSLLNSCDITKEILEKTGISTPLGEIIVIRSLSDGCLQIAGPSMNRQLSDLKKIFIANGAEKILIDGAISRKSLCSPEVAESVILCSGASYDKNLENVISHTRFLAEILCLEKLHNPLVLKEIKKCCRTDIQSDKNNQICKYTLLSDTGESLLPGIGISEDLIDYVRQKQYDRFSYIYIDGACTDRIMKPLIMSNTTLKEKCFVVKDSSCILFSKDMYEKILDKGGSFRVLNSIRVIAISINPYSAYGYDFDKTEYLEKMKEASSKIPVINVMEMEK